MMRLRKAVCMHVFGPLQLLPWGINKHSSFKFENTIEFQLLPYLLYETKKFNIWLRARVTVPFIYNFTFTRVSTHGTTQIFTWKFPQESLRGIYTTRNLPCVDNYARLTVPHLDSQRETCHAWTTYCTTFGQSTWESTRMIIDTTSHNIIMPEGE